MHCEDVRRHWSLYHDSEGDAELHFRISEHMAGCAACAQWYDEQSRLESLLAEKLRAGGPTPQLWDRVLRTAAIAPLGEVAEASASSRAVAASTASQRRRWWLAMVIGAALAAAVWGLGVSLRPPAGSSTDDLASLSARWHARLAAGEETLQFRSQSDIEVERYMRQRVPFPVRCPPRKDAGFAVEGAGVFRMGGQPAAYLFGYVDSAPVSIFVLPRDRLEAFPKERRRLSRAGGHRGQQGPYHLAMTGVDRNAVLAIGQTNPASLDQVLRAYGSYPHHPH